MNLKEIRELIEMVASEPAIEEFEFERAGVRVRIRQGGTLQGGPQATLTRTTDAPASVPSPSDVPEAPASVEGNEFHEITSPMVGTFYRAPSPDAAAFVKVGDSIEKGSVVCIIEAMKLMNEIESEVAGEVVSIRAENGQPVEYGDPMIIVRPR